MLALPRRSPDGIAYAVLGDSGPHVLAVHGGPGMDHVYVPSAFGWCTSICRVVGNISSKLGFNSRAQIAAWAAESGLLQESD